MQNEPNSVAAPNSKSMHASRQPVGLCDELTVRQLRHRTIVPVSMRIVLRTRELFEKL
jgi:hypothetical protein